MKIYGIGPSRSFRVLWAAEEAGVDYEYLELKFGSSEEGGARSAPYMGLNSQGKVPTLVDGDLTITESGAILNYLAHQNSGLGLIPKDGSNARAKYDEMCCFILTDLEQPLWTTGKHRFALPEEYRFSEIFKTTAWEFKKSQKALKALMGDSMFALGEQFTMADVLLGHTINWAERFKFEVDEDLLAYKARMVERPSYIKAMAKLDAR